jgi:hypothetical protein
MKIGLQIKLLAILFLMLNFLLTSCSDNSEEVDPAPVPTPGIGVVYLPIVVHVVHMGEPIGEGPNLSVQRIRRQIEILNEDFRKKEGTRGYNDHPDGGDAKIEFVLAKKDPEGNPINGINRINEIIIDVPVLGYNQNHYAQYAYWDPNQFINIWTTPLQDSVQCLALGIASAPETDLPGSEFLSFPQEGDAEGILINWAHFGESNIDCHARLGRTLTHEMGHYLGLLHTWGIRDCDTNDYCDDTPAVDKAVFGKVPFIGCAGEEVMIGNYMNYSHDEVMNIFTHDQIARMHYVLTNHPGRNALLTSLAI